MKHVSTFLLILLASFAANAQKSLFIQAGPVYSTYKNSAISFDNSLGYFAGLSYQDKFSQVLGVESQLYFLNQINEDFSARSMNAIFGVNLYPGQSGFHFTLGPEFGHTFDYKHDGEDLSVDNEIRFGVVGGVGYPVNDNISIKARYIHAIDHQGAGFDYNIQLGLAFKFFNR